ncbi:PAS domain-containing protein [Paucibacter sp. O1-1]|nr:PAS domain-containing protein [Paucibacter sp. O1-1]MDA3830093.1 PAS domain-containing protein [Paucibacter sp. O1-1]
MTPSQSFGHPTATRWWLGGVALLLLGLQLGRGVSGQFSALAPLADLHEAVLPGLLTLLVGSALAWGRTRSGARRREPERDAGTVLAALPLLTATVDRSQRCVAASDTLAQWLGVAPAHLRGPADGRGLRAHARLAPERGAGGRAGRHAAAPAPVASAHRPARALAGHRAGGPARRRRAWPWAASCWPRMSSTEQQALEVAQCGERRLRIILDQMPITVSYIDADLHYRYVNRAQEQWLGVPGDQVVGHAVRELVSDAVFADIEPRLRRALAGEEVPLERQRTDRLGNPVWHSGRHLPDVNDEGQVVGVYTVFFDITQRALAEQQLRERESELRQADCRCRGRQPRQERVSWPT